MRISDWSSDVCSSDLDGGEPVGRGFAQRTRELLQGREAVEFERIEGGIAGFMLALVAGDDLRLGLDVEAAQLVAQTHVGLLHQIGRASGREKVCQYV